MSIDRSEVNRALAKAIAFKACGRDDLAEAWAARLIGLLECAEILGIDGRSMAAMSPQAIEARK